MAANDPLNTADKMAVMAPTAPPDIVSVVECTRAPVPRLSALRDPLPTL